MRADHPSYDGSTEGTTLTEPTRTIRFDAEALAQAWLGAFAACSNDKEAYAFYRSVNMTIGDEGMVRFLSSDGSIVLTSEIEASSDFRVDEPEIVTALDGDYRLRDLLKFAFKTVTAKDAPPEVIEMEIGPFPVEPDQLGGLESRGVTLTFPADKEPSESVSVRLLDLDYPDVMGLLEKAEPIPTEKVAISPDYLSKIASVRKYWPAPMRFTFGGPVKMIQLRTTDEFSDRVLTGAVMPVHRAAEDAITEAVDNLKDMGAKVTVTRPDGKVVDILTGEVTA